LFFVIFVYRFLYKNGNEMWTTPILYFAKADKFQFLPAFFVLRIAVFLDLHDGMVAACLSLPGTLQLHVHHLWEAP